MQHDATISNDDVFTSNILESSDVCINPSLVPDVSPIRDHKSAEKHSDETDIRENGKQVVVFVMFSVFCLI